MSFGPGTPNYHIEGPFFRSSGNVYTHAHTELTCDEISESCSGIPCCCIGLLVSARRIRLTNATKTNYLRSQQRPRVKVEYENRADGQPVWFLQSLLGGVKMISSMYKQTMKERTSSVKTEQLTAVQSPKKHGQLS